jgi:hypothetical protein
MATAELRPMTLGEVLDRTFSLYKQNFWLFVGIAAMPNLVALVINVASAGGQSTKIGAAGSAPAAGWIVGASVGVLVFALLYLYLLGAAQAATVFAVSDLYLQHTPTVRNCYQRVGSKAFRVGWVIFLSGLIVGVGFLLLIIPGIILLCRTALAVPVSMLENSKAMRSIDRSMELTKGHALQIFVIFIMVWVVIVVATGIFQAPLMVFVFNAAKAHQAVSFGVLLLQHLSAFISQVLAEPIGTIAFSLTYYNLRVRKEAFDIQHLMASMTPNTDPNAPSVA